MRVSESGRAQPGASLPSLEHIQSNFVNQTVMDTPGAGYEIDRSRKQPGSLSSRSEQAQYLSKGNAGNPRTRSSIIYRWSRLQLDTRSSGGIIQVVQRLEEPSVRRHARLHDVNSLTRLIVQPVLGRQQPLSRGSTRVMQSKQGTAGSSRVIYLAAAL